MKPIIIRHNFDPDRFMWLWAKYVTGFNPKHHCTNSMRGWYSKILSKTGNLRLKNEPVIELSERDDFKAVYICGVSKTGYRTKENYPHNVHIALEYAEGFEERFKFEEWDIGIQNGRRLEIPGEEDLPNRFRGLGPEYTTCRIFRWAACYFSE